MTGGSRHGALALCAAVVLSGASCGANDPVASGESAATSAASSQCLVRLHGKGGTGRAPVTAGDTTTVSPSGNAEGWGGRQWRYFPDEEYAGARDLVADAVSGCDRIIVNGFSNGGAFAAKLYCRGERFGGRLVRVVVDDPVVDAGVAECAPAADVEIVLYWTGGLEPTAAPGWDCAEGDWTCEGGTTIGIDAYAAALGTEVKQSRFDDHEWYWDAPEVSQW